MKRLSLISLAACVLAALTVGCDVFNALATTGENAATSGLRGRVLMGPTCPVQTSEGDCAAVPVRATIDVLSLDGEPVKQFESDGEGNYEMQLDPGEYALQVAEVALLLDGLPNTDPRPVGLTLEPSRVQIKQGVVQVLTLVIDTGIR